MTARPAPIALFRGSGHGRPPAPVAHVHLGLGNFFRAHQAAYTDRAPDANAWGIAAFTGRTDSLARDLNAQDGLYTLVEQHPDGNQFLVVSSISRAESARDLDAWLTCLRDESIRVVTLTVTEAAYLRDEHGALDDGDPAVVADISAIGRGDLTAVRTIPGRLVAGLAARCAADAGPIGVLPCDNLSRNGDAVARVVHDLAERADPRLAAWLPGSATFLNSVVDRITPRANEGDRLLVETATGVLDRCPVVTEPYSEWVIEGTLPAGQPSWDAAGARLVDEVTPFERRKLWLLNGAHSLLAYGGSIVGHTTVAEAIADDTCVEWVEQWWHEAGRNLDLPGTVVDDYRAALLNRFGNPAMHHLLSQIAADGSQKLPVRVLPVLQRERAAGRLPLGTTRILAAWILHLRGLGTPLSDPMASVLVSLASGGLADAVSRTLGYLSPEVGSDRTVTTAIVAQAAELARS